MKPSSHLAQFGPRGRIHQPTFDLGAATVIDRESLSCTHCLVLQRAHKWFIVLLLISAVGGHWAVLQSVAWAQMLVRYSHGTTLEQGWAKTFSGRHPCKLCKLVQEGRKTERKEPMLKLDLKLEFTFVAGAALLHPPRPHQQFAAVSKNAASRIEAPPTPPPRFV